MRRRSLITPLLLILVGTLFLISNVIPGFSVVSLLSHFWPFLLIAWGAIRLVEIVYWYGSGRLLPSRGLNGGEWALIILVTIFGASHSTWPRHWNGPRFLANGIEVFGESYDYPIDSSLPAGRATRLIVENLRGNARIIGSDTGDVKVTGRKTIRAYSKQDADTADKASPLDLSVEGDQIIIRTSQERVQGDRRVNADLDITVPKSVSIECRGRYGDFEINDVTGGVEVASDNAGVRLQNIGGPVRIDLKKSDIIRAVNVKGPVELKGRGQELELENIEGQVTVNASYSGEVQMRKLAKPLHWESGQTDLRVERLPGQIRMALGSLSGSELVGPVVLTSHNRDVELSDFTNSLTISVDRGDIELRPGKDISKMEVRSHNGNIELSVPPAARFALKALTHRGEVENDFGAPIENEQQGRGALLRGSLGAGPSISLETDRGSITLRKADAGDSEGVHPKLPKAPAPPAPPAPPQPLEVQKE